MEANAIIAAQYPKMVIPLLRAAKISINVVVFDWRFYPTVEGSTVSQFNAEIFAAQKRGVKVRALVNSDQVVDRLVKGGCEARKLHSKRMLHTKLLMIDGKTIIIGSHNYTQHAFTMNHEASIQVTMPTEQNDFIKYFQGLWDL